VIRDACPTRTGVLDCLPDCHIVVLGSLTLIEELTGEERQRVEQAVSIVRRHRSGTLGMPRVRQALPDLRPERIR
jgi:hypothetical protein